MTRSATLDGSPFHRPGTFSRRTLLAGMLGVGAVAALDSSPLSSRVAFAAPPKPAAGTPVPPEVPYLVTASSELSDDVFATNDVLIGPDDRLLPYYNPSSKTVEALVLTGSSLNHLHRDPSQATGWAFDAFDLQQTFTSVIDVAVAADNDRVYALIVGVPDPYNNPTMSPYWLTWLDDAQAWDPGFVAQTDDDDAFPVNPGALKGGISLDGVAYFYTATVDGSTTNLVGWVTTGDLDEPLDPQAMLSIDTTDPNTAFRDFLVLYDTGSAADAVGYALILTADGTLSVYPQQGEVFGVDPLVESGTNGVTQLLWASSSQDSTAPAYVVQGNVPTLGEGTFFCDEDDNFDQVADLPGQGTSVVSVWLLGGSYTVNLLDTTGLLHTIQQTGPGAWAAPLPIANGVPGSLQPGLVGVYGVPTDPTRSTLFAVGADETLSVLSLDETGWTQTQVHQDDPVAQSLACYRLTIALADANGSPVRYGQAQLTSDRLVGLWRDVGSTILVPGTPITLTADLHGQIIVSIPAEELDAATLTVQALDADGHNAGPPAVVTADYDVRGFIGGSAALNGLGTMSGPLLASATNPDGSPLLPVLKGDGTNHYASVLSLAVDAGNQQAPAAGALRAVRVEWKGKNLTISTSKRSDAFPAPRSGPQAELSIFHLFDSIGHALRHSLTKLTDLVVRWADDLGHWVVDLATEISDLATYAINDMKDAFHVIGGLFTSLGADIKAVVTWLKREVLGFLSGVGKNATTIGTVLAGGPADLISVVGGIEKQVDGWFATQEAAVAGLIGELATTVEDATFGTSQPLTTPPADTGSSTATNGLGNDIRWISKVVNDAPGVWLYDKLMQHLPQTPGPDLTGVFDPVITDLAAVFTGSVDLATGIVTSIWDTLKDLSSPGAVTAFEMAAWFNQLNVVAQDALQLCDKVADTVLDLLKVALTILEDYLAYAWSLTSINPVLKLILDQLGFDPTISLNRLVSLVVAFPLTLVRTIRGQAPVFAVSAAARTGARRADTPADTGQSFLYSVAAVSQIIWTAADIIGDVELIAEEGKSERPQQPGTIDYFDIICPILETVLLLPGRNEELIWNGWPTDVNLRWAIAPAAATAILTAVLKIAQRAGGASGVGNSDSNVIQYYKEAPAQPSAFAQYYAPVISMVGGVANTVLASWYGAHNSSSTGTAVESVFATVLGDLSNVSAPLATYWLNESTEDVPVIVKVIIDGVGGLGAGTLYAVEAYQA